MRTLLLPNGYSDLLISRPNLSFSSIKLLENASLSLMTDADTSQIDKLQLLKQQLSINRTQFWRSKGTVLITIPLKYIFSAAMAGHNCSTSSWAARHIEVFSWEK